MKRISFDERGARRIFEWVLALRQSGTECLQKNGGCFECENIVKRLRKFIGKKDADWLVRQVKKHPYFPTSRPKSNPS